MAEAKAKILVVDDEPDIVDMLKMSLENASYAVVEAYDGIEAIEKAKAEKPDAIILDLMMPKKDGFETCKELKKDPEMSDIPVLVLTAIGQEISHTRYAKSMGLDLESDDFIPKPVDPNLLLKRLENFLGD